MTRHRSAAKRWPPQSPGAGLAAPSASSNRRGWRGPAGRRVNIGIAAAGRTAFTERPRPRFCRRPIARSVHGRFDYIVDILEGRARTPPRRRRARWIRRVPSASRRPPCASAREMGAAAFTSNMRRIRSTDMSARGRGEPTMPAFTTTPSSGRGPHATTSNIEGHRTLARQLAPDRDSAAAERSTAVTTTSATSLLPM